MMDEWSVSLPDSSAVEELTESFRLGPMVDDVGRRRTDEALVATAGPLRIDIFSNEHPPPHFRVSCQGQTANYRISDGAQLNGGLTKFHRNVKRWHARNKQLLIDAWNRSRPTHCPVGLYQE